MSKKVDRGRLCFITFSTSLKFFLTIDICNAPNMSAHESAHGDLGIFFTQLTARALPRDFSEPGYFPPKNIKPLYQHSAVDIFGHHIRRKK